MPARELPARPNLAQYKKQAKELVKTRRQHEPDFKLADAQLAIAREHGFDSWPKFAKHVDSVLADTTSRTGRFESAVDAIVSGDIGTVERLLNDDPALVRARSIRDHHSTLLHYIGANGVEGVRQRSPKNAVEIARLLIDRGAEVDAVADLYGDSTTLGLVATSEHPAKAGVQQPLIELLLSRGAKMNAPGIAGYDYGIVRSCLANGRPESAEFLAARGATLDLESAAGIGRLDVVRTFFDEAGRLTPNATRQQMEDGYGWACVYGRTQVVAFLLDHGVDVGIKVRAHGEGCTGLHLAAFHGDAEMIRLLLGRGARVDITDDTWHTQPLTWAVYAWSEEPEEPRERYYEVVRLLRAAGAVVRPDLLEWDTVRADAQMLAALKEV